MTKSCETGRDLLIRDLAGELDAAGRRELAAHLAGCPGCSREHRELGETRDLLLVARPPRPGSGEPAGLWQRLEPRLDALDRERRRVRLRGRRSLPVWALPAAAALAAAGLGLWLVLGLGTPARQPSRATPERVAAAPAGESRLDRYLARAEPVLLAISNRPPGPPELAAFDRSAERRRARELADEAAAVKAEIAGSGRIATLELLSDLELIFLQVANLGEDQYRDGMELVRASLDRRAILFQVTLEGMRRDGDRETGGRADRPLRRPRELRASLGARPHSADPHSEERRPC